MKQLFGIILLLFASLSTSAQQYYFKQYSTPQGLPQSEVRTMIEDKQGNLWLGTNGGGLCRLDGEKFTTFTKKEGLLRNDIFRLHQDSEQNLWIVYLRGNITKYDGTNFTHFGDEEGLFDKSTTFIFSILEDRHKNIWATVAIGNQQRALFLKKGDQFINYSKRDTLVNSTIRLFNVALDANKNLIISNAQGIQIFNGERFETKSINKPESIENKNFGFDYEDSKGIQWFVAVDRQGQSPMQFFQYDGQTLKPFDFPDTMTLPNGGRFQMLEDKQGVYWFEFNTLGIIKYKAKDTAQQFTLYNEQNGFPTNTMTIQGMLSDRENNIWVNTGGGGIVKFLDGNFINFFKKDGLPEEFIRGLYQDSKNNIWIGTSSNGLCKYDGQKIHNFPITETPNFGRIWAFMEEENGNMLVGTGLGLARLNSKENTYQAVNQEFGLAQRTGVRTILEEEDKIWFGTLGAGVLCYDKETKKIIKTLNIDDGLNTNAVWDVEKDSKGNYWIATRNGINKFDGKKILSFEKIPALAKGLILDLCVDKNDNVWLVDYNTGLHVFDGESTTLYDKSDGLAANLVYSVTSDKEGDIWIGTQQGLSELTIDENSQVIKIRNYNKADGLLGDEMNGKSIMVDNQNRVWAGHITGLSSYTPSHTNKQKASPPITQITKITPYLKEINWKDSLNLTYYSSLSKWNSLPQDLILPYDKNSLSFQFASSSHTIPEKVRYQWRLAPLDDFWVSVTQKTEADYTNLPAGDYTFEVRSMNHLNAWGEPATYSFKIEPPIWQTWWFLTLILTAISSLIFLAVWARLRIVEAQKKELEFLVDKRTKEVVKQKDEILEKNTELEQQQEEIMSQNEEMEQQSTQLSLINQKITEKNNNITASINYAKRIQDAMLPLLNHIEKALPESFVFYQPRDIVSGDFYWFYEKGDHIIIAAADCTGHGVPGAFLSLVASNLIHNIVVHQGIMKPDKILSLLHTAIYSYLKQEETRNQDGMDISLCHIDKKAGILSFAGAKNPLVYIQEGEIKIIKGTRRSIGGSSKFSNSNVKFENHIIKLAEEKTTFYIYSDGFQDQFGGENGGKFRTVPFRELLAKISQEPTDKQEDLLAKSFENWKGAEKQIDDVLVIGFKV